MPNVVIVGAGSLEFSSRLSADLLSFPALARTHFALVDVDPERLEFAGRILERIFREGGYQQASYSVHADRGDAFEEADYVIISILVGGYPAIASEIDIPRRYGVDQAIGDTLTPGGIMRCLRTLPELCAIADDVMTHCPDAWVLNYTNPMAMLCWGMKRAQPDLNLVGLCHSVQHTSEGWARRLRRPISEIEFECAGLNHQAWLLDFRHNGVDLLPEIRMLALEPRIWRKDTSRMEYIKHFGYPVTEASGHNSEYGAPIIHAMETDARTTIHGNVMNEGLIDNLAGDACVEVACNVDGSGIKARRFGELPTHLAAINQNQINVQRLAVDAAMTADPERVFQAMAMDPLTGVVCSLDEIRALTRDLLEAHRPWLPAFDNRPLADQPVLAETRSG